MDSSQRFMDPCRETGSNRDALLKLHYLAESSVAVPDFFAFFAHNSVGTNPVPLPIVPLRNPSQPFQRIEDCVYTGQGKFPTDPYRLNFLAESVDSLIQQRRTNRKRVHRESSNGL